MVRSLDFRVFGASNTWPLVAPVTASAKALQAGCKQGVKRLSQVLCPLPGHLMHHLPSSIYSCQLDQMRILHLLLGSAVSPQHLSPPHSTSLNRQSSSLAAM